MQRRDMKQEILVPPAARDTTPGRLAFWGKIALGQVMLGLVVLMAGPAHADRQKEIVSELQAEGYTDIEISTTWLRRMRIVAEGEAGRREIVLDPRNDEILRDYARPPRGGGPGGGGRPGRPPPPDGAAPPGGSPPARGSFGGHDRPGPGSGPGAGPGPAGGAPSGGPGGDSGSASAGTMN
ncbi:hypothetical protein CKO11_05415 [Rhodobacter sp. TJ_12]|uniref:hypothetical protein n=1 Tax=Rhodobacter sp. TJ_12 TaxID=2029399 RepID=UPI001CBC5A99|nr:hypothetical protein [Rhodobacter sp. TJ_12]MBZ4021897.1 hypothetical protein [Rhodobacter sp. TJ_12]